MKKKWGGDIFKNELIIVFLLNLRQDLIGYHKYYCIFLSCPFRSSIWDTNTGSHRSQIRCDLQIWGKPLR